MAFSLSLSGLNGAAKAIDVIDNNIANTGTIGFKASIAHFQNLYADAAARTSGGNGIGDGGNVGRLLQNFTQGGLTLTDSSLDAAVVGKGLFRLRDSLDGEITYTRDGQFMVLGGDVNIGGHTLTAAQRANGEMMLVNTEGKSVSGFLPDADGVVAMTGAPQDIVFKTGMAPSATSRVAINANLNSGAVPPTGAFDPDNPSTFNNASLSTVYDANGDTHELRIYYVKQSSANEWRLYSTLDKQTPATMGDLSFDVKGEMTSSPLFKQSYTQNGKEILPALQLDFSGTTQYAYPFGTITNEQNGYGQGEVLSANMVSYGENGEVNVHYSNGQSTVVARLALATFKNLDGLVNVGGDQWQMTVDSGPELLDTGTTPLGLGKVQGGATEDANVDLGNELVALIVQQRNYQANAQALKILDQAQQSLIGIR